MQMRRQLGAPPWRLQPAGSLHCRARTRIDACGPGSRGLGRSGRMAAGQPGEAMVVQRSNGRSQRPVWSVSRRCAATCNDGRSDGRQLRRFRGRLVLSGCCTVRWSARACCIFFTMSRCSDCDCATTWSIRARSLAVSSRRVSSGILVSDLAGAGVPTPQQTWNQEVLQSTTWRHNPVGGSTGIRPRRAPQLTSGGLYQHGRADTNELACRET